MSAGTPGRNIVLIGMMGAGKTTIGRLVAQELQRPFIDTDQVIESEQGCLIATVFAEQGESQFRRYEAQAVRTVAASSGQIIAVGGGAVVDPTNVAVLQRSGALVWLDAPVSTLITNLSAAGAQRTRPLLADASSVIAELTRLRRQRLDVYRSAATHIVDVQDRSPEIIAQEIVGWAGRQPGLVHAEERV